MTPELIWCALLTFACCFLYVKSNALKMQIDNLPSAVYHRETRERLVRIESDMNHLTKQMDQVIGILSKDIS